MTGNQAKRKLSQNFTLHHKKQNAILVDFQFYIVNGLDPTGPRPIDTCTFLISVIFMVNSLYAFALSCKFSIIFTSPHINAKRSQNQFERMKMPSSFVHSFVRSFIHLFDCLLFSSLRVNLIAVFTHSFQKPHFV